MADKYMITMGRRESNRFHIIHQALDLKIAGAKKVIVEVRLDGGLQITHKGRDLRYRIIKEPLTKGRSSLTGLFVFHVVLGPHHTPAVP